MDRAHKAIGLMKDKKMSMKQAAISAHIDMRTLKRAMRKMGTKRRKVKGRYTLVDMANKAKIDSVIAWMMSGLSASVACALSGTRVRTMAKTAVMVRGRPIRVIVWNKKVKRWQLAVCRLATHRVVFYGHIIADPNPASPNPRHQGSVHTVGNGMNLEPKDSNDDAYANIMWQCDFDDFTSALPPAMIPAAYNVPFARFIKKHEHHLNAILANYHVAIHFDRTVNSGVDDRYGDDHYVAAKRCSTGMTQNTGHFVIIVRVGGNSYTYPKADKDQIYLLFKHRIGASLVPKIKKAKAGTKPKKAKRKAKPKKVRS